MKFRFFIIPALDSARVEGELNAFCASRRIANVEKYFVSDGCESYWSICMTYIESVTSPPPLGGQKIDYREVFNDADFPVFSQLRSLRKKIADREGLPAYAVFTNEQLADMVRHRVQTQVAMGTIPGVGKARLEKYGDAFLELLRTKFLAQPDPSPTPTVPPDETNPNPS